MKAQDHLNITWTVFFFISLLIFTGCNSSDSNSSTNINNFSESVTEVLTLDNDDYTEKGLLVAAVSLAVTDSEENIYFFDPASLQIHSLTSDGDYRWSAGGEGRGPGFFTMATALYADSTSVYVYDEPSSRMTVFDLQGERIGEWSFGESGHRIRSIRHAEAGQFVTTGWDGENETLAAVYSSDFRTREQSVIPADDFYRTGHKSIEWQIFRNFPGSALPLTDHLILYSPAHYDGRLHLYSLEAGEEWSREGEIAGYDEIESPLHIHLTSEGDFERSHLSGFNPDGGYFHAEFTSMSHGLYRLDDGTIAHISMRITDEYQWDLVVEYIDPEELTLIKTQLLESLILTQQPETLPIWMDKSGKIYFTENSDTPLRVFRIE